MKIFSLGFGETHTEGVFTMKLGFLVIHRGAHSLPMSVLKECIAKRAEWAV